MQIIKIMRHNAINENNEWEIAYLFLLGGAESRCCGFFTERSSASLFFLELPVATVWCRRGAGAERRLRRADGAAEPAFSNCRVPASHFDSCSLNAKSLLAGHVSKASALARYQKR